MLEITSIAADLMRIFAQRHYSSDRYDDTTAIELLKYLQTLAHAEKVPTPKLDQYLAGEYPPVNIGCHIANILCNQCGMEDVEIPDMNTMPLEEYQDICKNIFPEIMEDFYANQNSARLFCNSLIVKDSHGDTRFNAKNSVLKQAKMVAIYHKIISRTLQRACNKQFRRPQRLF